MYRLQAAVFRLQCQPVWPVTKGVQTLSQAPVRQQIIAAIMMTKSQTQIAKKVRFVVDRIAKIHSLVVIQSLRVPFGTVKSIIANGTTRQEFVKLEHRICKNRISNIKVVWLCLQSEMHITKLKVFNT